MSEHQPESVSVDPAQAPAVAIPQTEIDRKNSVAKFLTEMSGGRLTVKYEPTAFLESDLLTEDRPSTGHLFTTFYESPEDDGPEDDAILVDDRKGPPGTVLVAELRRVASVYLTLARRLEDACEHHKPIPPREEQEEKFAVVLVKVADVLPRHQTWDALRKLAQSEAADSIADVDMTRGVAIAFRDNFNQHDSDATAGLWAVVVPMSDLDKIASPRLNELVAAGESKGGDL